jgi:hypothetical protein
VGCAQSLCERLAAITCSSGANERAAAEAQKRLRSQSARLVRAYARSRSAAVVFRARGASEIASKDRPYCSFTRVGNPPEQPSGTRSGEVTNIRSSSMIYSW